MKQSRVEQRAKWRELISEQVESGENIKTFCHERGIPGWKFYDWKKRLGAAQVTEFVAVQVKPEPPVAGRAIELRLGKGRSLLVEPGFDRHHLHTLLSVLEREA
jgi:hypothetical protein